MGLSWAFQEKDIIERTKDDVIRMYYTRLSTRHIEYIRGKVCINLNSN